MRKYFLLLACMGGLLVPGLAARGHGGNIDIYKIDINIDQQRAPIHARSGDPDRAATEPEHP